jgi:hypothetical protein
MGQAGSVNPAPLTKPRSTCARGHKIHPDDVAASGGTILECGCPSASAAGRRELGIAPLGYVPKEVLFYLRPLGLRPVRGNNTTVTFEVDFSLVMLERMLEGLEVSAVQMAPGPRAGALDMALTATKASH